MKYFDFKIKIIQASVEKSTMYIVEILLKFHENENIFIHYYSK